VRCPGDWRPCECPAQLLQRPDGQGATWKPPGCAATPLGATAARPLVRRRRPLKLTLLGPFVPTRHAPGYCGRFSCSQMRPAGSTLVEEAAAPSLPTSRETPSYRGIVVLEGENWST